MLPESQSELQSELPTEAQQRSGHQPGQHVISLLLVLTVVSLTVVPALTGMGASGLFAATILVIFVGALRPQGFGDMGFRRPGSWVRTWGLALWLGTLLQLVSMTLLDPFFEWLTGHELDLSGFDNLRGQLDMLLLWLGIVWMFVVFVEELLFRGFLISELRRLLGGRPAAMAVNLTLGSVLFGLAHWYQGPAGVLSTGFVGMILALLFVRSGNNLWLPILLHGVINTVGLVLIYLDLDRWLGQLW